ncbi:hypothetical protein CRYUN_Cryun28dG0035400 [Craigia yunnanensis]
MDPSSYVHHHQHHHDNHLRYVPMSPTLHLPPPPSHPPSYQQSPNSVYPSRHHFPPPQPPPQLWPPPPPPPQQQQQPYHPLPAPPPPVPRQQHPNLHPYNPHHPQYTLNPNFNSNPSPNNVSQQFHDFPQRRVPEFDSRPDNRVSRPHRVSNLDREAHYHQFDRRPASPGIDRFRHDLEGSSRFGDLELNQREREELGRVHSDRWISDRSTRDFGTVSMGFESSSNNLSFRDHNVTENVRWGSRLHDQLIDNGNNEINERDVMRVFSRKKNYHYDSETERFSERGSGRDGSHELNRTPRRHIQKKSALLRIQKATPNHRSREDERSHYLGYYNEGETSTFRGKDMVLHLDNAMEEKEREGSPVELDVSFKLNSLVAKAIVTPSSAPISDSYVTPRNSKIRRVMLFDKDCSSLQPNKTNECSAKLGGSTCVVNSGSGDCKKSEGKIKTSGTCNVQDGITKPCSKGTNVSLRKGKLKKSPKVSVKLDDSSCVSVTEDASVFDKKQEPLEGKGTIPCISNMVDGGAQTCYDKANLSVRENKVEGTLKSTVSDKTGASVGKLSSFKATKKKTIVGKVVKRVTNSPLNLANSDSAKKGDQSVKADTSTRCPSATSAADKSVIPLKMKIVSTTVGSVHGVVSECCLKESALLLENGKVNVVSKEVGTDVDPGSSVASKIKRKRNRLTPPLSSSGHEETKVDQGTVNADNSVHGLHIISNIKEDRTETPNESITSGTHIVEDVIKQCYHNESNISYGLSRSEDIEVPGDIVDIGSSSVAVHSSTGFNCGSSITQKINITCDIGNVNSGSKQVCATTGGSVVDDGTTGGLPEANCSVGSNKMTHLPCSEETQINSDSIHADCFNHNRSTICTPDIGYVNSGESNHEIGDGLAKHLSPSILSIGNSGAEGIPSAVESLECKDEYAANVHKRKVGIGELDLSSSAFTTISIGSADCLDTTMTTCRINSNPAEAMVSGIGWLDVGLQHSGDKVSILHRSSSNDTFPEVSASADGKSLEKKRKISTSGSSVTASVISQGVAVSDIFKSAVQLPSNFTGDLLQLKQEVKVSSMDDLRTEGIDLLLVNSSEVVPSQAVGYLRDAYEDDHASIDPSSAFVESVAPSSPCLHPLKLGGQQLSTAVPVSSVNNHQINAMDVEGDDRVKVHVDTAEDQKIISSEVTQCGITPEDKSVSLGQRLPGADVEDVNHLPLKDDLPSASNSLVFGVDANEVSVTNSNDEAMDEPDIPSDVGSPNNHDNLVISTSTCKRPFCPKSEEKAYGDEKLSDDKPMIEGVCNSSAIVSYTQHSKTSLKSNDAIQTNQSVAGKAGLLPSHDSKNTNSPNFIIGETHGRKNQLSHVVPKSYPTRSSFVFSASKNTSSTKIIKPRTWHRTDNSSATFLSGNKASLSANPLQRQMPKKSAYFQSTSYIRKGNSLVRTPVSVPALRQGSHSSSSSVYRLNYGVVDEVKGTGPNSTADAVDLRTGGANTSFERPTTAPLSSVTKVPNFTSNSSGEFTSSPLAEPCISDCFETTTDHPSYMEINDVLNPEEGLKTSETLNQNGSVNNLEHWTEQNEGDMVPSNAKRVTYVKPKSNQLVATSDCERTSILNADKNQSFSASSDGYYKKSKNQLIRTALESHIKQAVSMSDDKSNSVGHMAAKVMSSRTFGKRRSNKVVAKTHKPSKFSLVWTLHGARLSNNDGDSLRHPKVLPQLFPWKRKIFKRSFKLNSVSSCNSSLSSIGRKMLLLRKRNTVYTRSINGFSIQKSKVVSVGGSSLKWSQSIERHSKKANEEATLAVAEAERKKRERNGTVSGTNKRSHSSHKVVHGIELRPGERIFRIGSVRYKMDSSRRSLQRISDGESSCSADHLSENSAKNSYVPRRLVIGNDEYVRIGNGNQLVSDPKKRTRVLASEKVRWSLHTARLRLFKKRKYCQFFTRFGKCNKDDGKCPYIHDPSKIAVCTKFLKGLCSNLNCKLTHKVIPDRMPDCSYFLQGLCTNENCPYRHVHVNPNGSTCEGFLRGYCADGNECRKKHSYVCPNFEATGSCPQGSKCKLHHPKNRSKVKKSKRSMEHKNARGRYFGIDILEPKRMVSERHQTLDIDDIFFDGKFSDYISLSLDVSNDEVGEFHRVMCDQTTFGNNDSSDLHLDELDELIKPIRIMNA